MTGLAKALGEKENFFVNFFLFLSAPTGAYNLPSGRKIRENNLCLFGKKTCTGNKSIVILRYISFKREDKPIGVTFNLENLKNQTQSGLIFFD